MRTFQLDDSISWKDNEPMEDARLLTKVEKMDLVIKREKAGMVGVICTTLWALRGLSPQYVGPGAHSANEPPIILLSLIHNCLFHTF